MRSSMLCLGLLSVLSACSSGSGGGAPGAGNPAIVAKTESRGVFTATKQSALSEFGGVPQGFELTPAAACGDKQTYDSRLLAGDVFVETQSSASAKASSHSTLTTTIRSVDAKHLSESILISDLAVSPSVPDLPSQVQINVGCEITNDKDEPVKCDIKYVNYEPPQNADSQFDSCESDFNSNRLAKTSGTVALGQFKLASGVSVSAQSTHRESSNVDIKCGKGSDFKLVGTGSVVTDEIITHDLVTRDASMCTPTTYVYRKTVFQLDDGTVLYASSEEKTQAPKR